MKRLIKLKVNGEVYEVAIHQHRTLAEVLREELDLIGTKEACNEGDCGSCTVILDGKTVTSCLTLAIEADGKEIRTIEGMAAKDGKLSPLQQSFVDHGAIQCGYCTPGMVMSATALLEENPKPTEDEVRMGIAGNICRCTGYTKIVEAILATSEGGK
ncbi:MAG: (2Fe-2S)-binding protein [Desulfobacterales bacterium]|nr:(2Fe-2S)-binding protein [Desulfobacterales bacterium]